MLFKMPFATPGLLSLMPQFLLLLLVIFFVLRENTITGIKVCFIAGNRRAAGANTNC